MEKSHLSLQLEGAGLRRLVEKAAAHKFGEGRTCEKEDAQLKQFEWSTEEKVIVSFTG